MKKILLLLILFVSLTGYTQSMDSQWQVKDNSTELTLNYQMLGQEFARGAFYGSAGYGLGMWLSGNKTEWGIVGAFLVSNLPILIDGSYKDPEVLIGRNVGTLLPALSFTFTIELKRKGKVNYQLPNQMDRR